MLSESVNSPPPRSNRLWAPVVWLVVLFTSVLIVETALRVVFPWDMYFWSESPVMTNLMKLTHHLPAYTSPADGNSFVYSPGFEYLAFGLLKPLGLQLDVRYCRLVNILLALAGVTASALATTHLAKSISATGKRPSFFPVAWCVAALVLFKNFTADVLHPDNIHALHALAVFWLCLTTVETKRFGLALLTMVFAGMGVLTKQTEALCWVGPAVVFAILNPWGWRRWCGLVLAGAATLGVSLFLLWLPPDARFFTWQLPVQQGVSLRKLYPLAVDLLTMDRALLFCLALFAFAGLLRKGGAAGRYLICWMAVGVFSVLPNLSAYLKVMGTWNNLIIFQDWMILIVWPFFALVLDSLAGASNGDENQRTMPGVVCFLTLVFLCLLLPMKIPPRANRYEYCRAIENHVRQDLAAGHKVLVSHGAEFLIRAGAKDIPLDRANTLLEMTFGKVTAKSAMPSRIKSHYYDRLYLRTENWYGDELLDEIKRYYALESVIKSPGSKALAILGYQDLMDDCQIWVPRAAMAK